MIPAEIIGWISSLILVMTIGKQIHKQWSSGSSDGVSTMLFAGQLGASIGFTIYSFQVRNWVFVVTNALMALSAMLGYVITLHQRRRASRTAPERARDRNEC